MHRTLKLLCPALLTFSLFQPPAIPQGKRVPRSEEPRGRPLERADVDARKERRSDARAAAERPAEQRPDAHAISLRFDRVESLQSWIEQAPPTSALKGWRKELAEYAREFDGRFVLEREARQWMNVNLRGGAAREIEIQSFRGALRELSDVVRLREERLGEKSDGEKRFREVRWNTKPEPVEAFLADGRRLDLGNRIVDIVAVETSGRAIYVETKNADLTRQLSHRETELLSERSDLDQLALRCLNPEVHKSRAFEELVKDLWLSRTTGRETEWRVNVAPSGLGAALATRGVTIRVLH
ncbi:MAG: hypothetical protein JNJ88_00200 [Planctomycetes bacterium]|nr:hypothetical protein [Planctomycetota bacterium]